MAYHKSIDEKSDDEDEVRDEDVSLLSFIIRKRESKTDIEEDSEIFNSYTKLPPISKRRITQKKRSIEQDLYETGRSNIVQRIPYFTIIITVTNIVVLIMEIIYNGGVQPLKENFFLGPSAETLITLGAKDSMLMSSPNFQLWRLITAMFLHVGVFHLLLNLLAQIPMGYELERSIGTLNVIIIYIASGIGGNITSAIFLPKAIECGSSTALFGWASVYIVEYCLNYQYYQKPSRKITLWIIGTFISLLIGLLPGIDNFAHIGGSLMGIFTSLIVVPPLFIQKKHTKLFYIIAKFLGGLFSILFLGICIYTFYYHIDVTENCHWCEYTSCLPVFKEWCAR